eukprot:Platyproteum_vivax@DN607_c0_g1_i1.p1
MNSLNGRSNLKPFSHFRLKDCTSMSTNHCTLARMYTRAWEASNVSGDPKSNLYLTYGQEYFNYPESEVAHQMERRQKIQQRMKNRNKHKIKQAGTPKTSEDTAQMWKF